MGPFFKKDLLILWRSRNDMLLTMAIFLLMIITLGFTTSTWIEKQSDMLQMRVAVVNEDNQEAGLVQFKNELSSSSRSTEMQVLLQQQAEQGAPLDSFLRMLDAIDQIEIMAIDKDSAEKLLEDKEITAIINIPAGFTLTTLNRILLNEQGSGSTITLSTDYRSNHKVEILEHLIGEYSRSLNLQRSVDEEVVLTLGGREMIEGVKPLTSLQYYTMSISIIAGFFVSTGTALKSLTEKREQVLQRIMLSGNHHFRYLLGRAGGAFCKTLLQLVILVGACQIIFNLLPVRSLSFWIGLIVILAMFALSVAGVSVLFTTITLWMKESAASGLLTLILMVLGTIGGSFIPIYFLPDWLIHVGEYTPNGLTLSILLQWIQHDSFSNLVIPFLKLGIFSIGMLGLGYGLFPRRERI